MNNAAENNTQKNNNGISQKDEMCIRDRFNTMLFIGFIALNIASSSVTIRVEMRWIYVSLAGALLFLSYIYGELTEGVKTDLYLKRLYPWGILFALYVLLMLPAELFYRCLLYTSQLQHGEKRELV